MQVHYYVEEDIIVDGASDIGFVVVSIVAKIIGHPTNYDGLSIVMLISKTIGGFSLVNVFATSTFMNT